MKSHLFGRILLGLVLLYGFGVAQANIEVSAVPREGEIPAPPPPPPAPEPPPEQTTYSGVGRVDGITRKAGGDVYRLDLLKPVSLIRVEAFSALGRAKIIALNLVTEKSQRIPIRQLAGVTVSLGGSVVPSETLNIDSAVTTIEVYAEAMGGEASLNIRAISLVEAPRLALRGKPPQYSCNKNMDDILKEKLDPIQLWASRAESSAAGSIQEKFAGNQLSKYVRDFIANVKAEGGYTSASYLVTLVDFFVQQFHASRPGGVAEASYREMITATYNVLLVAIENELPPCRVFSADNLMRIAVSFYQSHEKFGGESRAGQIYASMMTRIRDFVPPQYHKEISPIEFTFRQADTEGVKYYKLYTADHPDGFLRPTHRDMSNFAFAVAERALKREVKLMDVEQRYQLIVEYQEKYNNANVELPQDVAMKYLVILADQSYILRKMIGLER